MRCMILIVGYGSNEQSTASKANSVAKNENNPLNLSRNTTEFPETPQMFLKILSGFGFLFRVNNENH